MLSGLVNEYKTAGEKELQTQVNKLTKLTEKQSARIVDPEGDVAALQERKDEVIRQQEEKQDVEKERKLLAV